MLYRNRKRKKYSMFFKKLFIFIFQYCIAILLVSLCPFSVFASQPQDPPVFTMSIGSFGPSDFYVVDIATDSEGNIYTIDPMQKKVSVYDPTGVLQLEIKDPEFTWLRGITVDSLGRIYVLDPTEGTIRIYSFSGELEDIWEGFASAESMGVDEEDRIYVAIGGGGGDVHAIAVYNCAGNEILRLGGTLGSGPGEFRRPHDVAVSPDGSFYVADTNNSRIQKFDAQGNYLFSIGRTGVRSELPGEFNEPVSVFVDSYGNLFVSDRRNYRIQKFNSQGEFLSLWGSKGYGNGQFLEHHGLTVGPDDTVWVAGYHGHDIQHFNNNGDFIDRWQGHVSGPGEFADIMGLAVVDDLLFVVDKWNNRIQALDSSTGEYLFEWGERGQGDATVFNFPCAMAAGPDGHLYISDDDHVRKIQQDGTFVIRYHRLEGFRPRSHGLAVSPEGILFMSDRGSHRIIKYDIETGEILQQWGGLGSDPGEFNTPNNIGLGPDGSVFIADTGNQRVQKFTSDGQFVKEWGADFNEPVMFSWAEALTVDQIRNIVYVGDQVKNRIYAFDLDGTYLFSWGMPDDIGQVMNIWALTVDKNGSVYLSDKGQSRILKFEYPEEMLPFGRPSYLPGQEKGYFLWQDEEDGEWHFRWCGEGPSSEFQLIIRSNGFFSNVRPFSFESPGDELGETYNEITVNAHASTWEDGVDFFVSPGAALIFDSKIDDIVDKNSIYIGASGTNPSRSPFVLVNQQPEPEYFSTSSKAIYNPGESVGYYLWQDNEDSAWHLRWSSDGTTRKFIGSIQATDSITNVTAFSFETNDSYVHEDFWLRFDGWASTWHDGIDFHVPAGAEVALYLSIDNQPLASQVFVGSYLNSPSSVPFTLISQPLLSQIDSEGEPSFKGGQNLGYFIWQDTDGKWFVQVSGDGESHLFAGVVTTTQPINNFAAVSIESNDFITQEEHRIEWELSTSTWIDGFSFTMDGGGNLMFDLYIDGELADSLTFIGAANASPEQVPFRLE